MFDPHIKIDRALYDRLKKLAEDKGYSSVDEFAQHILEKVAKGVETSQDEESVTKQLKGLGYIE